ncbi:MAG: signal peptidase I [Bacilli bacterium]|nr:signal peptidase I [Bacilli bacterium]
MDFRGIIEFIKDTFSYILVIIFVLIFFIYICSIEQVVGPSMSPTLKEDNIVLINKIIYKFKSISRNDVVVIKQEEKHMIKRIIGLPGETISYKNNDLYINDKKYEESYLNDVITNDFDLSNLGYDVIPDDMYLVLGDNRENSKDSRNFGLIKKDSIIGKAWIKFWPINQLKFVK